MDYRKALSLKMKWEKVIKPKLKIDIAREKEMREDNIKGNKEALEYLEKMKQVRPYLVEYETTGQTKLPATNKQLAELIEELAPETFAELIEELAPEAIGLLPNGICAEQLVEVMKDVVSHHMTIERLDELTKKLAFRIKQGELSIKRGKYDICAMSYIYNGDYENGVKFYEKSKQLAHLLIEDVDGNVEKGAITIEDSGTLDREHGYNQLCKNMKCRLDSYELLLHNLAIINGDVKQVLKAGKRMNKRNKKHRKNDE